MSEVFMSKQPVLDPQMNVFAYELQFHSGLNPNQKTLAATDVLIKKTQDKIGFQSIVGNHAVMLHLPSQLVKKDSLPDFDDTQQCVLEIANTVSSDVTVLRNLKELKSLGFSIALADFIDNDSSAKLVSISDFVKIDVDRYDELKLKSMVEELHEQGVKVIALNVDTEEKFRYLKKLGFDYFQGYSFNNPVMNNDQALTGNKLVLLQLLAKVNDPTTDFHELSQIISQDVTLSHKLLVVINNPAAMIPIRVESIADALKYLGLKRLKFWVNTLMLSSMESVPQELLTSSLMRAKFSELLASHTEHKKDQDTFFLVGLFSNLGAFFKTSLEEIVLEMPLSDEVKAALIQREGIMGEVLNTIEVMERADDSKVDLRFAGLTVSEISENFMLANAWAQQAMTD